MEFGLDAVLESAEEDCDELTDYEEEEQEQEQEQEQDFVQPGEAKHISIVPVAPPPLPKYTSSQLSVDIPPSRPILEDGEIDSPSDCLHLGSDLRFVDNELDAAILKAKKVPDAKRKKKKKKKKKKRWQENNKEKKNSSNDECGKGPEATKKFIFNLCRRLKEPKTFLIEAAIERLGFDVLNELVREVDTIEAHGGQMTVDGKRRRTAGGVLWNVLRARYKEDYKAIMASGRDIQKLLKRKLDEDRMDIDDQPAMKRRRTVENGSLKVPSSLMKIQTSKVKNPSPQVDKTTIKLWSFKKGQMDSVRSKLEPENSLAYTEAVCAWTQSVKVAKSEPISKDSEMNDGDVVMHEDVPLKKGLSVAERLRAPVMYDDLLEI